MKYEKRLSQPFNTMNDLEIIRYFYNSESFLRKYMSYTKKNYKDSSLFIREILSDIQKESFVQFVKVCHKAYSDPSQDRRGFFNQIIAYLQDESKLLYQKKSEEELSEHEEEPRWFIPASLLFLSPHKYLYDFSIDFFLNNSGETELRKKYKLNRQNYIKTLIKIKDQGLVPIKL
jgi:hypothetical protein